jgi:post-segregation antitoxin (ccd killing protein)
MMSEAQITISLPYELVKRARSVGIEIEDHTELFIELLEAEIKRRETGKWFLEIADQLQSLSSLSKPTQEEIEAEIRACWAEKALQDSE